MTAKKTEEDLFVSLSLFQEIRVDGDYSDAIGRFIEDSGHFDAYCPFCCDRSTFYHAKIDKKLGYDTRSRSANGYIVEHETKSISSFKAATCGRNYKHIIEIVYRMLPPSQIDLDKFADDETKDEDQLRRFVKVGQFPSQFDFAEGALKAFAKELDAKDMQELRKALVSSSYGYGAAAFLYARRVFERLIENKRLIAEKDGVKVNLVSRMEDKVKALADYLPDFLVENAYMYKVLGAGVHELSDEVCTKYFPIVFDSTVAILEEDRAAKHRQFRAEQLKKDIGEISTELGVSESNPKKGEG